MPNTVQEPATNDENKDYNEWNKLRCEELRKKCIELNLSQDGRKASMIARLVEHFNMARRKITEINTTNNSNDNGGGAGSSTTNNQPVHRNNESTNGSGRAEKN